MTDSDPSVELWSKLPELSDPDLTLLASVAANVLVERAGFDSAEMDAPNRVVLDSLIALAREEGLNVAPDSASRIADDNDAIRQSILAVLSSLPADSELAREIASTFVVRKRLMVLDAGISLGLILLVLAVKLKRLNVSKQGLNVEFNQLSTGGLNALRRLILG